MNPLHMHRLIASAGAVLLALVMVPAHGNEPAPAKLAPVLSLYRDFAWQATVVEPELSGQDLLKQPREVLQRYFDPPLTELLLKERACVKAFSLCALDHSVLWDTLEPAGVTVRITQATDSEDVVVRLFRPGAKEPVRLLYRVTLGKSGYRISNVRFEDPNRPSLLKALETPRAR